MPKSTLDRINGVVPADSFSRPILHAAVDIAGIEHDVWVSHLKSKRPILLPGEDRDDPFLGPVAAARALQIRAIEAIGLRQLIVAQKRASKRPVILIGDFNDGINSVSTQIITGQKPWKKLPAQDKLKIWRFFLWDAVELAGLDPREFNTHLFNGYKERLDGIFLDNVYSHYSPDSIGHVEEVRLFDDHLRDETLYGVEIPRTESDHGQWTARIVIE